MKPMKFRVTDEAHSRAIQTRLFELGYCWWIDKASNVPQLTTQPYLYADDDSSITCSDKYSRDFFEEQSNIEYMLHRGELVPAYPTVLHGEPEQPSLLPAFLSSRGVASAMPGADAWTIVVFKASDVPVGTQVYA